MRYTGFTREFRFWRLTFSVSLPDWTRSVTQWLFHPIRSLQEYHRLKRQKALEAKWTNLFSTAFTNKPAPEFEFDEVKPGRVVGLKETPSEAKLPSVGIWSADPGKPNLDKAIKSAGMKVNLEPADMATIERRIAKTREIQNDIWDEEVEARRIKRKNR